MVFNPLLLQASRYNQAATLVWFATSRILMAAWNEMMAGWIPWIVNCWSKTTAKLHRPPFPHALTVGLQEVPWGHYLPFSRIEIL